MSDEDKKAYMQLDSETEAENICWRDLKSEWGAENCEKVNPGKMAEIMKIVDIYRVNGCMNGCSIRTSRFNHSCRSNAEATGDGIQVIKKARFSAFYQISAPDQWYVLTNWNCKGSDKHQIWGRDYHQLLSSTFDEVYGGQKSSDLEESRVPLSLSFLQLWRGGQKTTGAATNTLYYNFFKLLAKTISWSVGYLHSVYCFCQQPFCKLKSTSWAT